MTERQIQASAETIKPRSLRRSTLTLGLAALAAALLSMLALAGSSGADTLPPPLLTAADSFPLNLPGSGDSLLLAGGRFYAIAADKKSVTVMTLEGRKLRSFGAGTLVSAVSVALGADGTAYVIDQSTSRTGEIDRFDSSGKHLGSFIGRDFSRQPNTFYPKVATFGADGRLYVVTLFDIQVFNSQGALQEVYSARGNSVAIDDAVALLNGDLLYSAAFELRLIGADGALKRTYTAADFGRQRLLTLGAAVAPDGTVYVTDIGADAAGGGRLLRIGKDGTPLPPLPFRGLAGKVAVGPDGAIYLYDKRQLTRYIVEEADPMAPWARYYRPALFFDSAEPWRPLNVNSFLREVNPNKGGHEVCKAQGLRNDLCTAAPGGEARDCPDWNCASPAGALALLTRQKQGKDQGFYLDISDARNHPKLRPCDGSLNLRCDYEDGETNALYYHAFAADARAGDPDGTVYFDYWAFYRYNASPVAIADNHEGDWEGVLIATLPACAASNPNRRIDCRLGGAGEQKCAAQDGILWIGMRSHQYEWRYLCGVTKFSGSHVNTYVAAGSHASYPQPCKGSNCDQNSRQKGEVRGHEFDLYIASEGRFNGRTPWKGNSSCESVESNCILSLDALSNAGWSRWQGDWGKPESRDIPGLEKRVPAPQGPIAHYGRSEASYQPCLRTAFDKGLPATERNACDGDNSGLGWPVLTVPPLRVSASAAASASSECSHWFGPLVVAAACDPRISVHDPAAARLQLSASGAQSASTAGIAQLVAAEPLHPGDKITVSGSASSTTQIAVRVSTGLAAEEVVFERIGLERGGTATITVSAPLLPSAAPVTTLKTPAGKKLQPTRSLRRLAAPKSLKVLRKGARITVSYRATAVRSRVELRGASGRVLVKRIVVSKVGQVVRVVLNTRAPVAAVKVTSLNGKQDGPSAVWRAPSKR